MIFSTCKNGISLLLLFVFSTAIVRGQKVPVLCYHQIRDWTERDSKFQRQFILPVTRFNEHMKALHDEGYTVISAEQLVDHYRLHMKLPAKAVVLTFDDGTVSQYRNALPELEKYGYKVTFFIMTVTIGHKDYLTSGQIKELYDKGNIIGCHTWDHHNVTGYSEKDWITQLVQPLKQLEGITDNKILYFAYPNGMWDDDAMQHLKKNGIVAAFQLSGICSEEHPLLTLNRLLVDGNWSGNDLIKSLKKYP